MSGFEIGSEDIKVSLHTTAPQDTGGPVMKPPTVSWGDTVERITSIFMGDQLFVDRNVVIDECATAIRKRGGYHTAEEFAQLVESLKEQP